MTLKNDEKVCIVQEKLWETLNAVRVIRRNDYHYERFIYHLRLAELELRKVTEKDELI